MSDDLLPSETPTAIFSLCLFAEMNLEPGKAQQW